MYRKGDKIVYPLYGAGVIEGIEEREIDGKILTYYVLEIPVGNLRLSISTANAESQRLRFVHQPDEVRSILNEVANNTIEMPGNWSLRYKENLERIKSGDLKTVALVFNTLLKRERLKGLSTAEKKMMTSIRQIIVSEIMIALNFDKLSAEDYLSNTFKAGAI